jgi:outer membrane protein assembly factor BamB
MRKKLLLISMILLGTVLLSACTGGARSTSWPGLAANGDVAYLADGPLVYAISLKDGKELWHYPEKGGTKQVFYSTPVITPDGLVIVGSSGTDHSLIAINPNDINPATKTPVEAWTFTGAKDPWFAAPLIIDNLLFAPNSDGNLYVLDLSDGHSTKQAVKTVQLSGRLWAQPVTDGKRIFITSLDKNVFGVDLQTYEYWHQDLAGAIPGSPAIGSDGMLYVGSLATQLEKFDPATGTHKSALTLDAKKLIWSTPVSDGDALYFGDLEGNFYSFNTTTGKLNWDPIQPDGPITATPLVLGDNILLATESGSIFEVDKAGHSKLWSQPGGNIYTNLVLAGDLVIVAPLSADNYLYAFDVDGHQTWAFTPGK